MTPQKARERMLAVYTRMPVNPAMISMFSRYFAALDVPYPAPGPSGLNAEQQARAETTRPPNGHEAHSHGP